MFEAGLRVAAERRADRCALGRDDVVTRVWVVPTTVSGSAEPVVHGPRLVDRADLEDRVPVELQTREGFELSRVPLLEALHDLPRPRLLRVQVVEDRRLLVELRVQEGLLGLDLLESLRPLGLELLLILLLGRERVPQVLDLGREVRVLLAERVHVLHARGQIGDRARAEQELDARSRADDVGLAGAFLEVRLQTLVVSLRFGQREQRLVELGGDLLPPAVRHLPALGDGGRLHREPVQLLLLPLDLPGQLLELRLGGIELLLGAGLGPGDLRERREERDGGHHREGAAEHDTSTSTVFGHWGRPFPIGRPSRLSTVPVRTPRCKHPRRPSRPLGTTSTICA